MSGTRIRTFPRSGERRGTQAVTAKTPADVTRVEAEKMANAAQALFDWIRATPLHVIERLDDERIPGLADRLLDVRRAMR